MTKYIRIATFTAATTLLAGIALADDVKLVGQKLELVSYNQSNPCTARKYKNTFHVQGTGQHSYKAVGYGMLYDSGQAQTGTITLTAGQDTEIATYWKFDNGNKAGKTVYVTLTIDGGAPQHLVTKNDTCSTELHG